MNHILPAARFDSDGKLEVSSSFLTVATTVGYYTTGPAPSTFEQNDLTLDAAHHFEYGHTQHYNPTATRKLKRIWQALKRKHETLIGDQVKEIQRARRTRRRRSQPAPPQLSYLTPNPSPHYHG